nr:hypothetical protein [Streptomyces sp. REN17]
MTTPDNFVPAVLGSGLPAASCGPPAELTGLIRREDLSAVPEGLVPQRYLYGRAFGRITAGSTAGIAELAESWRPDLMVCEQAEFAGSLVAASRGVPRVQYHLVGGGTPRVPARRTAGEACRT